LGGVVIPHDGQCYLEQAGNIFQYTMAETLVSQVTMVQSTVNFYILLHVGLSISWTHKLFSAAI